MFSTTLTCIDAYPRSISAIQGLLTLTDKGRMESKIEQTRFHFWMVIHIFVSIALLLIAKSGEIEVKEFVFAAMTGSFLTAPIFAWMAIDTINSKLVSPTHRYGILLNSVSWVGMVFLIIISLLFISNSFLGLGAS